MKPETRRKMYFITGGEAGVTIITIIITLGFFESGMLDIIRNVIIGNALFLIAYFVWVKIYAHYRKMYEFGLKE